MFLRRRLLAHYCFGIPAANQFPPALRISRTGFSHGLGGRGVRISSIRKSPLDWSGTRVELCGTVPQNSLAPTLWPPLVPIPLPPASRSSRPSTEIRPSVITSTLSRVITHGMPAGLTPCTTLGAEPPRSGWVPIPPSNLTNGPCASAGSETKIAEKQADLCRLRHRDSYLANEPCWLRPMSSSSPQEGSVDIARARER